jgi:hypothetical protein
MAGILAAQSAEMRAKGEALIQQADKLFCESWNERMWSDGEPIDPSPTIDRAINGGFPWLEIQCSRCKTPSDVDLAALKHPPTTFVLISPADCGAGSAPRPGGVLQRHCCSLRGNRATPEPVSRKLAITVGIIDRHLLRP